MSFKGFVIFIFGCYFSSVAGIINWEQTIVKKNEKKIKDESKKNHTHTHWI